MTFSPVRGPWWPVAATENRKRARAACDTSDRPRRAVRERACCPARNPCSSAWAFHGAATRRPAALFPSRHGMSALRRRSAHRSSSAAAPVATPTTTREPAGATLPNCSQPEPQWPVLASGHSSRPCTRAGSAGAALRARLSAVPPSAPPGHRRTRRRDPQASRRRPVGRSHAHTEPCYTRPCFPVQRSPMVALVHRQGSVTATVNRVLERAAQARRTQHL